MSFYGRGARHTLEAVLTEERSLADSQISDADIDGVYLRDIGWTKTDMQNTSANNTVWENCKLKGSIFKQCSFMRSQWRDSVISGMRLEGLTLIGNSWERVFFKDTIVTQNCMTKNRVQDSVFRNCTIRNVEGVNSVITNTLFMGSVFSIDRETGMNGFIQSVFRNCIFYNCFFEGEPLEGALIQNSVFCRCGGNSVHGTSVHRTAGDMMNRKNMTEGEISRSISELDDSMVRTMLIQLLLEESAEGNTFAGSSAQREPSYANFAQAVAALKNSYDFRELDLFSTEADLVYVQTSERKILLTDTSVPVRPKRTEGSQGELHHEDGQPLDSHHTDGRHSDGHQNDGGRFSRLEIE